MTASSAERFSFLALTFEGISSLLNMNPRIRQILSHRAASRAFTLIEVLVVVAMIALIVAAMAPMVFSSLVSTRLTSAGRRSAGSSRWRASWRSPATSPWRFDSTNMKTRSLPGRSLLTAPSLSCRSATARRGCQRFAGEQLTDTYFLPSGIVLGSSQSLSPTLASGSIPSNQDLEKVIKRANNARYKAFQINPDSSTNLTVLMGGTYRPDITYFTVAEERVLSDDNGEIPKKLFRLCRSNPDTARTSTYRP